MRSKIFCLITAITSLYFIYLSLCSALTFDISWDFIAYHLPHALKIYELTTFKTGPFLTSVNDGFPPLAHYLQGLTIFLTGRHSAANLINLFGLLLFVQHIRFRLKPSHESLLFFFLAILAIPLVQIHLTRGYIDLWSNIGVASALIELNYLFNRTNKHGINPTIFLISIFAAVFSKYQMWPLAYPISLLYLVRYFTLEIPSRQKAVLLLMLTLILSIWPIRNIVVHQNPIYPLRMPVLTALFPNYTMPSSDNLEQTPKVLHDKSNFIKFFNSALEFSRINSTYKMKWSIDQFAENGPNNEHHRMGGWSYISMILLLALSTFARGRIKYLIVTFVLAVLVVSILPQSHELRYWFFIPLILSTIAMDGFANQSPRRKQILIALMFLNMIFVSAALNIKLDTRSPQQRAPSKAQEFWKKAETNKDYSICELPNAIFYSGPEFKTFKVSACH